MNPDIARLLSSNRSGSHGSWKKSMYQDDERLTAGRDGLQERRGVRNRQRGQRVQAVGKPLGDIPGDERAPVMADEVYPLRADWYRSA